MCLILLAWRAHPDYPLVVAANRDEFFARPSAAATFWPDAPQVLAGRDLEAGGTWMGITRQRRFAALTNFREGRTQRKDAPSRGALVSNFLTGTSDPETYLSQHQEHAPAYNGFNLLVSDTRRLGYLSNRNRENQSIEWLPPGIYGLSNHLLDTPWPKLASAKSAFREALSRLPDIDAFFDLLLDDEIVPDTHLPATGVPIAWERVLSAVFVKSPDYGTRASTVLACRRDGAVSFVERRYGPEAKALGETREVFQSSEISTGV